jgi:hypothetical protein
MVVSGWVDVVQHACESAAVLLRKHFGCDRDCTGARNYRFLVLRLCVDARPFVTLLDIINASCRSNLFIFSVRVLQECLMKRTTIVHSLCYSSASSAADA